MHGGDFNIDKKTYIYILFFMVGFMIAIVVIDSAKIPEKYVWMPLVSSIFLSTVAILYTVEDVRLHEVVLAAVSAVILSFITATFGAISSVLLLFQGISAGLGFASASVPGMAAALTVMGAAAVPAVVVAAAVADPAAAAAEADYQPFGGGKRRRGGLRWRW